MELLFKVNSILAVKIFQNTTEQEAVCCFFFFLLACVTALAWNTTNFLKIADKIVIVFCWKGKLLLNCLTVTINSYLLCILK